MADSEITLEPATELLKSIPEFLEALSTVLQTPWGWLVLLIVVSFIFINRNFSFVIDIYNKRRSMRIDNYNSYLKKENYDSENMEMVMRDAIDTHFFKVATGIYAEDSFRISLIKLHELISYKFSWKKIKCALPYIEADADHNVTIRRLKFGERAGVYYNVFVGLLLLTLATAIFINFIISEQKTFSDILVAITATLGFTFSSMFIFSLNLSSSEAERIREELSKINVKSSSEPNFQKPEAPEINKLTL